MEDDPLKQCALMENSASTGTVTRKMVRERAVEAANNGRVAQEASKSDWEQAKRELAGEPEGEPKPIILESAPESERLDPMAGSTQETRVSSGDGEDDEGRSHGERCIARSTPVVKVA